MPAELVLHPRDSYVEAFVRDLPKIKFITARDIMDPPEAFTVRPEDSAEEIIGRMDRANMRYIYIANGDRQVVGALDYFQIVGQDGINRLGQPPAKERIIADFPSATRNTFLEELLTIGSRFQMPIAVRDEEARLLGCISREKLLNALAQA
jgi:glycine betaine/proline transport system ATP-binding protein